MQRSLTAILVLTLALGVLGGCDRTRPLGGAAVDSGSTSPPPPPATGGGTGGGVTASGPMKVDGGWKFVYSDAGASSVALAGSFNGWSTNADPLKKGADGVWVIVKDLPSGTHLYKFVVNGTDWKEDPANPDKADDGFGGSNSQIQVP